MRDSEHDANLYMSGSTESRRASPMRGASDSAQATRCEMGEAPSRINVRALVATGQLAEDTASDTARQMNPKSVQQTHRPAGVAPGPLTNDWDAPNGHLIPASLRSARAVIEAGYLWRCEQNERFERRHEYGAKAVGMLSMLLTLDDLPECYREQAREIVREWER